MISKINRLRGKKGFTIIELIVVIAIIGVLAAIIAATMSYDARPSVGKSLAKDLYYVAQDAAVKVKVAHPNAFSDTANADKAYGGYTVDTNPGFFIQVDNNGAITKLCSMKIKGTTLVTGTFTPTYNAEFSEHTLKYDGSAEDDFYGFENIMGHAIKEYLATKDCYAGTYYVLIDKSFRVDVAYWISDLNPISDNRIVLADDCIMPSGDLCCAYPASSCDKGSVVFLR